MFEIAIRSLEESRSRMIEGYNRDLAGIDAAIAQLRAANENGSSETWKTEIQVRPGQYKGMKLSPALEAYLLERGGGPVDIDQAVKDLALAGGLHRSPFLAKWHSSLRLGIEHHQLCCHWLYSFIR